MYVQTAECMCVCSVSVCSGVCVYLRGVEWHMCGGARICSFVWTYACASVCVCVHALVFVCVSKGVYAVHAHFPLLHVCTYSVYSCVYMQSVECMRVIIIMTGMFVFRCVCLCVSRSYTYTVLSYSHPCPLFIAS